MTIFSWFDYRSRGFDENRGLRIDLLLASQPLAARCIATGIDYAIRGMENHQTTRRFGPNSHFIVCALFKYRATSSVLSTFIRH